MCLQNIAPNLLPVDPTEDRTLPSSRAQRRPSIKTWVTHVGARLCWCLFPWFLSRRRLVLLVVFKGRGTVPGFLKYRRYTTFFYPRRILMLQCNRAHTCSDPFVAAIVPREYAIFLPKPPSHRDRSSSSSSLSSASRCTFPFDIPFVSVST